MGAEVKRRDSGVPPAPAARLGENYRIQAIEALIERRAAAFGLCGQSAPGRMTQRSSRDDGIQQACTRLSGDVIFKIFCGSTYSHPPSRKNSMSTFFENRIY